MAKHTGVTIEVSGGGSSVGVSSAGEGSADIGMSSRDIKSTEMTTYPGLVPKTIARDGIALIVHPDNPLTSLIKHQVKGIYNGTYSSWTELLV
jgi:phosphate transport system substrate-binding protein